MTELQGRIFILLLLHVVVFCFVAYRKFWTRNRPGDAMRDKYNLNIMAVGPDGEMLDIGM